LEKFNKILADLKELEKDLLKQYQKEIELIESGKSNKKENAVCLHEQWLKVKNAILELEN